MIQVSQLKSVVLLGLVSVFSWGLSSVVRADQPIVKLTTNPPISQVLPFEAESATPQTPVRLTLEALSAQNQPLSAKIRVQILTPPANFWFPTDFPRVEGTKLLDLTAIAPQGQLQIQQMLPIRGVYQVQVYVAPLTPGEFQPFQQQLQLPVTENQIKFRNFGYLVLILLGVGFGGGWVIGYSSRKSAEVVPQRVRLLLSSAVLAAITALIWINVSAQMAESHTGTHRSTLNSQRLEPSEQSQQGLAVQISGDQQAVVGQPANLVAQVTNAQTGQPATNILLEVTALPVGEDWTTLAYQVVPDANGKLKWQQQFFDGNPHQITVRVLPQRGSKRQFQPFQVSRVIDVKAIAPPLGSRLIVLTYLSAILSLGFLLGLGMQKVSQQKLY